MRRVRIVRKEETELGGRGMGEGEKRQQSVVGKLGVLDETREWYYLSMEYVRPKGELPTPLYVTYE